MENKYTSLSVKREDKDLFLQLNIDWNIKNPTMRKTKEEFFRMMINMFKENHGKKDNTTE